MKPSQLKRLIAEVIREVEAEMTPDPKANTSSETDFTKNQMDVQKKGDEAIIKMTVRGVKPGGAFKKFLAKMTADAIAADWAVLKADMEKSGVKVASMNPEDLKAVAKASGKPELAPQGEEPDAGSENEPEMPPPHIWKKMSPEEREKYIKPGSHEADWKAATERDSAAEKEKLRKRAALAASGNLDWDDEANRPVDTSLWTDKDWDFYNKNEPTPEKSGDEKYKPTLKKATAHVKKGAISGDFSNKLRH